MYPRHVALSLGAVLLCTLTATADITVLAEDHSDASEGVIGADGSWGGLAVCHGEGGMQEWLIELDAPGAYWLHAYYASGEERPVTLSLNGVELATDALGDVTGGFLREQLEWVCVGEFDLAQGENRLSIATDGLMPHLAGWVISTTPDDWDRSELEERFPDPRKIVIQSVSDLQDEMADTRAFIRDELGLDEILFIKRITYSANHYYTEYINSAWTPGGGVYALSLEDGQVRSVVDGLEGGVYGRMDLSFDSSKVVFGWKADVNEGYRIYEADVHGSSAERVLDPPPDEAELVAKYFNVYHHGTDDMHPCYLPDGGIAFISTRCQAGTLCDGIDSFTTTVLYRMQADGSQVTRLSYGALSEAAPSLLPDGRIVYTRWEYVDKGAVSVKGLWAMRPDGTGSVEVYGNTIQFPPTLIQARAIPDTPGHLLALGCPHYPQNALGTVVHIDAAQPFRTDLGLRYLTPQVKILAEGGWDFLEGDGAGHVRDGSGQGPLFRDPYPLDDGYALVSYKPRGFGGSYAPNGYGLYLLSPDGSLSPIYHDPDISSWQPMPLRPRPRPPVVASTLDPELASRELARCVVTDIHQGLEGAEQGSIKYLRILEQIPRPWLARRLERGMADEYDQQHAAVSKDTALGLKALHGVVPVEADGSAHFLAPANANVFLQALDENYLSVQTERTFVNYMPGESRSCVGCHETSEVASPLPSRSQPMALTREASIPQPQPGDITPNRPLHYPSDVQPVWDRHCLECHNADLAEGGLDLSGTPTRMFSTSYEALLIERRGARTDRVDPGLVPTIGENHPKTGNVSYLPARSLGSHGSLLMAMLMPDGIDYRRDEERLAELRRIHASIELTQEELVRVGTWVDTNAQFYGSYFGRRNIADQGHPDFRPVPTWESAMGVPNAGS